MNNKLLVLIAIVGVIGVTLGLNLFVMSSFAASPVAKESAVLDGILSVEKNGELIYRGHNTLTNLGKTGIHDRLAMNNIGQNISFLAVGNGTDPAVGDSVLNLEISTCGFYRPGVVGSNFTSVVAVGNWSYEYTFASACNEIVVNTSGMYNASTGSFMFWGDNFSSTTLQSGDTLKITWNISVSG